MRCPEAGYGTRRSPLLLKCSATASQRREKPQPGPIVGQQLRLARFRCLLAPPGRGTTPPRGPRDASLHRAPPAGADPDAVLRQPHRVRDGAPDSGRRHRPDAEPERHLRRQDQPRPADRRARPRQADVGAVLALDRRHPAARRFRPLAVAEHAGRRAAGRAPARHLPARLHGAARRAHRSPSPSAPTRPCARTRPATTSAARSPS